MKTVATAESCTGGLLAHLVTETPGASAYFLGGVTAYHDRAKELLLGVPPEMLRKHGSVSAQTAKSMAEGIRAILGADVGISITGIAGPGGGTKKKPVGLVYIALSDGKRVSCRKSLFSGNRAEIRNRAAKNALDWLRRTLSGRRPRGRPA